MNFKMLPICILIICLLSGYGQKAESQTMPTSQYETNGNVFDEEITFEFEGEIKEYEMTFVEDVIDNLNRMRINNINRLNRARERFPEPNIVVQDYEKQIQGNEKAIQEYEEIGRLLNEGQQLLQQEYNRSNYEQAISLFNRVMRGRERIRGRYELREDVNHAPIHFYRGLAWARLQRDRDAIIYFNRAMNYIEKCDERYSESLRRRTRFLLNERLEPEIYYHRGLAKARLGRYAEALADFDEAISTLDMFLHDLQIEVADIDQAIFQSDMRPEFYYHRGFAKVRLGRYAEALADIDKAIEMNPEHPRVHRLSGIKQEIEKIISHEIDTVNVHLSEGQRLFSENKLEEARTLFDRVMAIELNADAYYYLGRIEIALGNKELAIHYFDGAISLNPQHIEALYYRGIAKNSIEDFKEVIRINPLHVKAHFHLGLALLGKRDQYLDALDAIESFNEVIRLDPLHVEAHFYLGLAIVHAQKDTAPFLTRSASRAVQAYAQKPPQYTLNDAIESFNEVIRLDPLHIKAHFHREVAKIAKTRLEVSKYKNYNDAYQAIVRPGSSERTYLRLSNFDVEAYFYLGIFGIISFFPGANMQNAIWSTDSDDIIQLIQRKRSWTSPIALKHGPYYLDFAVRGITRDNPNYPYKNDIYYLQAFMLIKMGSYDDALTTFDKIDPEDSRFHHRAFIVQLMNKETEEGEGAGTCSPEPLI